jgi:hypothetical protein
MKAPRHRRFGGQTLGGIVAIASFALLSSACIAQADSGDEGSTEASESRVTTVASNINAGLAVEGSSSATTDPSKSGKGDGPVLTSANNHLPVPQTQIRGRTLAATSGCPFLRRGLPRLAGKRRRRRPRNRRHRRPRQRLTRSSPLRRTRGVPEESPCRLASVRPRSTLWRT